MLAGVALIRGFPLAAAPEDVAGGRGREVVVVYNTRGGAGSKRIAEYYAKQRGVPDQQVIGLRLPETERVSRDEFQQRLWEPLRRQLLGRGLLRFQTRLLPAERGRPGKLLEVPVFAAFRYLVLCHGVPVRVLETTNLVEPDTGQLPPQLQRNRAAVDSELALLTFDPQLRQWTGATRNLQFGVTNAWMLNPTNGITMVARLDGPTPEIALGLVDKARAAETNGLWGRAFFDARGLKEGGYQVGDEWILSAAEDARKSGFETIVDLQAPTFAASYPMPQIALYAGWYDNAPSGPFARPEVEFMPGAIAYHLYSFSARTVRAPTSWVGALLARGATATMGYVEEPYLDLTVNLAIFFERLLNRGFTFGEAAYAAQPALSWQTTVVGDPLYRPFGQPLEKRALELARRHSPLLPWALLATANRRLAAGDPPPAVAQWLAGEDALTNHAVLRQKLGDLFVLDGNLAAAAAEYAAALKLDPSPQQRIHLQWGTARMLATLDRPTEALEQLEAFFQAHPDYPDSTPRHKEALALAKKAGREDLVRKYEAELERPATTTNHPPSKTKP